MLTFAYRNECDVPSRSDVARLLHDFDSVVRRFHAPWYVFGAQAVVIHGRPRLTEDVDITLQLDRGDATRFAEALSSAGFRIRIDEDVAGFVQQHWVLPMRHEDTGLDLDIVFAGSGLESLFFENVVEIQIGEKSFPVISAEDLVIAKILAGRPKDLDDAAGVLELQGEKLDVDRVRALLMQLEEALAATELVPALDRMLRNR